MSVYKTSKKVRYITSIIFVLFMTFIVGGSYLSQQEKSRAETKIDSLNNF
ncbi:hypothetical protein BPLS_P0507 [Bathymodiolus platifrons methanotrophic gill symbiont]|nr:hypothetical protein BPLS_P0507 [Bathymodiolus platifrons methanotrophic gill symbiont]